MNVVSCLTIDCYSFANYNDWPMCDNYTGTLLVIYFPIFVFSYLLFVNWEGQAF